MHRRFYILSKFKMPTLETGPGDLVMEDLIDIHSEKGSIVIDDERSIHDVQTRRPELKYCFMIDVKAVLTP